jgi:hypothetical protein
MDGGVIVEGMSETGELLMEMTIQTVRLQIMMAEADEQEWKTFGPRYAAFVSAVGNLPRAPTPRRAMGFKAVRKVKARPEK